MKIEFKLEKILFYIHNVDQCKNTWFIVIFYVASLASPQI
jgi:hypothetical protein